ncbi:unnamed protein product [Natator depressus]
MRGALRVRLEPGVSGLVGRPGDCTPFRPIMVNFVQAVREYWVHILCPMGFVIGCYLDRRNDEKLSAFRNKSMLFKRELKPGEEVTWK